MENKHRINKAYSLKPTPIDVIDVAHGFKVGSIIDAETYFSSFLVETKFQDNTTETCVLYSDVRHLFLNTKENRKLAEKIKNLDIAIEALKEEKYRLYDEMDYHVTPKLFQELSDVFKK